MNPSITNTTFQALRQQINDSNHEMINMISGQNDHCF